MENDKEICEDAEVYTPAVGHIYRCNGKEGCPSRVTIPGLVDKYNKPLYLCAKEMKRQPTSGNGLEKAVK